MLLFLIILRAFYPTDHTAVEMAGSSNYTVQGNTRLVALCVQHVGVRSCQTTNDTCRSPTWIDTYHLLSDGIGLQRTMTTA
ncbi:hypothetical protein Y032_0073g771 [Ancylostoma ceylanicum]|uniref:Secreted protein n=1 Tax=Ancylostoma ceylanicum TaxID=53326 RepID=A0A016TX24_9BILA|nr:hypothetical protein Y032_0073g771 [Ancylostoma ceylanicum]